MHLIILILAIFNIASADILSDYVSAPDDNYKWFKVKEFRTLWGSTAHVLNVTS
jgi:hypothetical protein